MLLKIKFRRFIMKRRTTRKIASFLSVISILAALMPIATAQTAMALPGVELSGNTRPVVASGSELEHSDDIPVPTISDWADVHEEEPVEYVPTFGGSVVFKSSTYNPELMDDSYVYVGNFKLTFYCPCSRCNGNSHGITASGTKVTEGRTIAVDPRKIALGSTVHIDGLGDFIAEDTGGAIKSNKIDVLVGSHSKALSMGIRYADVYVKVK